MRYFIIAGEHSGDIYAGYLIDSLMRLDREAEIAGIGGREMEKRGVDVVLPMESLAIMGVWEVVKKIWFLAKALRYSKRRIRQFAPDVVVLLDFPGFNLKIAKWAKARGFKVVYYIPPKFWAWGEKRAKVIQQSVDKALLILPFEPRIYSERKIDYEYVGHPLVEQILRSVEQPYNILNENIIAVMPGSRKQEIRHMMGLMLRVAPLFPNFTFVVIKSDNIPDTFYNQIAKRSKILDGANVIFARNLVVNILRKARLAIVKSGTATLEVCLYNVPQIVCYKTSWLTYQIAKRFVKVPFISLPNLIAEKEIVPELIQQNMRTARIEEQISRLLTNSNDCINHMLSEYCRVQKAVGYGTMQQNDLDGPSSRAARAIIKLVRGA